jgi:hypothetical protein
MPVEGEVVITWLEMEFVGVFSIGASTPSKMLVMVGAVHNSLSLFKHASAQRNWSISSPQDDCIALLPHGILPLKIDRVHINLKGNCQGEVC